MAFLVSFLQEHIVTQVGKEILAWESNLFQFEAMTCYDCKPPLQPKTIPTIRDHVQDGSPRNRGRLEAYVSMYVSVYVSVYVRVCVCTCMCICVYVGWYVGRYVCIYASRCVGMYGYVSRYTSL